MRTAKLIVSLNIKDVIADGDMVRYHQYTNMIPAVGSDGRRSALVSVEDSLLTITAPIIHIRNELPMSRCKDTYIAYTQEVEDMLGIPIRVIFDENKMLRERITQLCERHDKLVSAIHTEVTRVNNLSLWDRFLFLIKKIKVRFPS